MKVYIITISDVYDFQEEHVPPIVKLSREEAREELARLKASAKEIYEGQFDGEDSGEDSFSLFPDGYWGTSHYDAVIDEVDVPDIKKA